MATWDSQWVIAEPCITVKDRSCVDVCPVDCIYDADEVDQLVIQPDECIACGACEPVCPVDAIRVASEFRGHQYEPYIKKNIDLITQYRSALKNGAKNQPSEVSSEFSGKS